MIRQLCIGDEVSKFKKKCTYQSHVGNIMRGIMDWEKYQQNMNIVQICFYSFTTDYRGP